MKITGLESNEELLKILGGRVKDYRINARITQEKLAEDTGLSLRTIVNIETGKDVKLDRDYQTVFFGKGRRGALLWYGKQHIKRISFGR